RLDDSELDSEHGVEQGCSAHGRRGSEGWFGNPRGTPSAVRVPQPFLLAHLVPTDPRRIPPPCDEITPARLPPNLSESRRSLKDMTFDVSGCCDELIEEVKRRLR